MDSGDLHSPTQASIADLILDWEDAVKGGDPREARDYFASHPAVQSDTSLLAAVLTSISSIERFDRLARNKHALPDIPGFRMEDCIGAGGMGVVYRAFQYKTERFVAIKVLSGGAFAQEKQRRRFAAEARIVAQLEHPNIVRLYEYGETEQQPYQVVELLPPGNLDTYWSNNKTTPREVVEVVETLARAIDYAHRHVQRIIHRDLKPSNVLRTASGEPKIADFGLAKMLEHQSDLSETGGPLGTAAYMAPEQLKGEADQYTDVYGLGAILFRGLTGRAPFAGSTLVEIYHQLEFQPATVPSRLVPGIDRDLDTICLKCLEKDKALRYESAAELARDLRRYLDDLPIRARHIGLMERTWRFLRANPQIVAVLLFLILAAASTSYGFLRATQANREAGQAIDSLLDTLDGNVRIIQSNESLKRDDLRIFREDLLTAVIQQLQELVSPTSQLKTVDPKRVVTAYLNIGQLQSDLGNYEDASQSFLQAAAQAKQNSTWKHSPSLRTELLIEALNSLASTKGQLEQHEEASHYAEKSLRIAETDPTLVNSDSQESTLARCYEVLGELAYRRRAFLESIVWYEKSLPIRNRRSQHSADATEYFHLSNVYRGIGLARHKSSDGTNREQIQRDFNDALTAIARAQSLDSKRIDVRQLEGRILSNKGMADRLRFASKEDPNSNINRIPGLQLSKATLLRAVQVRRQLWEDYPAFSMHREGLAAAIGNLADTISELGELHEAVNLRREAIEHLVMLHQTFIKNSREPDRDTFYTHYLDGIRPQSLRLARALHELSNDADALAAFRRMFELKIDPDLDPERGATDRVTAAICWVLMAKAEGLLPDDTSEVSSDYAVYRQKIIFNLNQAVEYGLSKQLSQIDCLEQDPLFDHLRDDVEFDRIVKNLKAKTR